MSEVIFSAATRGDRYSVTATKESDGTIRISWFTRNNSQRTQIGYDREAAGLSIAQSIYCAKLYDGTKYIIQTD